MDKILLLTISLLFGLSLPACANKNGESTSNQNVENIENKITSDSILIVYFSRAGGNYPNNTYLTKGRTAVMGEYIKEYTGGTIFEIEPTVTYPNDYEDIKKVSQREKDNNERPSIKNPLTNLDSYDVVFVGSPIWYGAPPMIMRTFYEQYDLSNKTIIPFGTHEGSGISTCTALVKEYFPNAKLLESYGLKGQEVDKSQSNIENWLQKIGISKKQ